MPKKICVCGQIFNPDFILKDLQKVESQNIGKKINQEILACPKCSFHHHLGCLKQHYDKKCYSCKFDLADLLYKDIRQRKREIKYDEKK